MDFLVKRYLNYAKRNTGSSNFRSCFVIKNKKRIDVLRNGKLSCAFFVSSVLKRFNIINDIHVTVISTIKDMKLFGWKEEDINYLQIGDVVVWEKNKSGHYHIGFYVGKNMAISNIEKLKSPQEHHYTYCGKRKIIKVLRLK